MRSKPIVKLEEKKEIAIKPKLVEAHHLKQIKKENKSLFALMKMIPQSSHKLQKEAKTKSKRFSLRDCSPVLSQFNNPT